MEGSPYQVPVEPEKSGYSGFAPLEAMEPIFRRRWWVRFLGIVLIVVGGVYTLTIFGALFRLALAYRPTKDFLVSCNLSWP